MEKRTSKIYAPKVTPALDALTDYNSKNAQEGVRQSRQTAATAARIVAMSIVTATLLAAALGLIITRVITRPLNLIGNRMREVTEGSITQLEEAVVALRDGDLTVAVSADTRSLPIHQKDELGQMAVAFATMDERLGKTIGAFVEARSNLSNLVIELRESAVAVSETSASLAASTQQSGSASQEIAHGSEKLAHDSTDAASTMEQLLAQANTVGAGSKSQNEAIMQAVNSLSEATDAVSGMANHAKNMAQAAQEGNEAVTLTVQAMNEVGSLVQTSTECVSQLDLKSQHIGEIVRTIEGIAEQTNLLALNAAIEAARAGEHGRGFAVVADEVRKLAEQSSSATKEIAQLINGVTQDVEHTVDAISKTSTQFQVGIDRTRKSGTALESILQVAEKVSTEADHVSSMTSEITNLMSLVGESARQNLDASSEMGSGAQKVAYNIQGVAAISEESAASAEELSASIEEVSAAAQDLNQMSTRLRDLVASFKVEEGKPSLRVAA